MTLLTCCMVHMLPPRLLSRDGSSAEGCATAAARRPLLTGADGALQESVLEILRALLDPSSFTQKVASPGSSSVYYQWNLSFAASAGSCRQQESALQCMPCC